jgi:hypothetical protein
VKVNAMCVAVLDESNEATDVGFVYRTVQGLYWEPSYRQYDGLLGALQDDFDAAAEAGTVERSWEYMVERGLGHGTSLGRPFEVEADTLDGALSLIRDRLAEGVQHVDA